MICDGLRRKIVIISVLSLLSINPSFAQPPDENTKKREAVPENLLEKAVIPGFEDVRAFGDEPSLMFQDDLINSIKDEPAGMFPVNAQGMKECTVLAISGGGANGAYGAGLISGWTKSGTRPQFKIVTGISTGALTAPFAFLGKDYDDEMKALYTTYSTKDIMRDKAIVSVTSASSLEDNEGLKKIVENNFTPEILAAIAKEHKNGKRLYVATTNLDAERLVVWDMGKIALVGNEKALKLFRDVIVASAAIPIVFPPSYFDVVADGKEYQEIHVDGGTVTQITALIGIFNGIRKTAAKEGVVGPKTKVYLYLIRNGYFAPYWSRVRNNLPSIAQSAMDTLTKDQGAGDIYRTYTLIQGKNIDFNLAYIPSSYVPEAREMFDLKEMSNLFNLGYNAASKGYPWEKTPPMLKELE